MNRSSSQTPSRMARCLGRLAMALALALAGAGAGRAQTGPVPSSPGVPNPYQSPLFHSGFALTPGAAPYTAQPGQVQGTPSAVFAGVPTYIPSFLLGDYDPALPPSDPGIYYPEHFADGSIFSWEAPFSYVSTSAGTVTVDDTPPSAAFAVTGGFVNVLGTLGTSGDLTAGTATNGEYDRLPPNTNGAATWTLTATVAGSYSVYFHIPDNIADSSGVTETRSTGVDYTVAVSGAFAQTVTATVSQTEANSLQYLAGPFQLAVGDTVTVTLQRDLTHNAANVADFLIADSMTLQAAIGDVRSTPTAINYDAFPADFALAKYWGIYTPAAGTAQVAVGATAASNAIPDTTGGVTPGGTPIFRYGDPTLASDSAHRIRQMVFFGRSEPTINFSASVDNSDAANFSTPSGAWGSIPDPTATGGSYLRVAPTAGAASATAKWTLTATNGGNYFVSAHLPQGASPPETRISDATYHVTSSAGFSATVKVSQVVGGAAATVVLPTGPIPLTTGQTVTVVLDNTTASATTANTYVVADSVSITTGNGQGAIYCVDGFTGGVLWRFATPASPANGPSAPVFSAPAVAKINVLVTPAGPGGTPAAVYANKLVVIVGDDNGMVYCLDAIGHGDGTSNANVLDANGNPITIPQPVYGATPPVQVDAAGYTTSPHVGTTSVYWIYRPNGRLPKDVTSATGALKKTPDPNSDLPVPAAFGSASPTIFVDPSKTTTPTTAADSNAIVYVGNSNGVLYALNPIGVGIDGTSQATYQATGDAFNVSLDLRNTPGVFPAVATDAVVPTCQPLWWFTLRGPSPGSATTFADIESAPALYVALTAAVYTPTVYIGSAHEQESTSNVGRLYALNGIYGPSGAGGKSDPSAQPNPLTAGYTGPGSLNYNVGQRATINAADTTDWSFPDAYGTDAYSKGQSSSKTARPALGNVTGSPVVFTNFHDTTHPTRVYFAANVGIEVPATVSGGTASTTPAVRPDDTQTGRIWAVNLDGSVGTTTNSSGAGAHVWAYPVANDPNNAALDNVAEPFAPIGSFLNMTPAIGFVQFPAIIANGDGSPYNPSDVIATGGIKGQSVPVLYFGTRGVDDTALYAVDIDGDMTATTDHRTIYHVPSPDGAIFQSSPILITNATTSGGNGGSLLIVGGDTLYDFSATPVSNPVGTEAFPLIREDRAFVGFGPLSSPAVAATDVRDLFTPALTTPVETDWVYVGDSSTGLCKGITPNDTTDLNIPPVLQDIVPPSVNPPVIQDLTSIIQTYLVDDQHPGSTKAAIPPSTQGDALAMGLSAPLPVYEWGQNVYIRFSNVVPPNPTEDVRLYVHDSSLAAADFTAASASNPITFYSNPGTANNGIRFTLSEIGVGSSTTSNVVDNGIVPPTLVTAPASVVTPLGNGFVRRTDTDTTTNLVDSEATPTRWIGAYTYAIGDGTARRNTPGGRRRVQDVSQVVSVRLFTNAAGDGDITNPANFALPTTTATTAILQATATNGNQVSVLNPTTGKYGFAPPVKPVDQPTFGILNPLGVRGAGVPLPLGGAATTTTQIGYELGPFRGTTGVVPILPLGASAPTSGDTLALEALANGNSIYQGYAPPSSSGVGVSPIILPPTGSTFNPATAPETVVTSTGLIANGGSGDNLDNAPAPNAPAGTFNAVTDDGLAGSNTKFGSAAQPFALDIFDRSPLGLTGRSVKVKMASPPSVGGDGMSWNDNAVAQTTGHDAVVNYLPWEAAPTPYKIGANSSPDYPNIGAQNVAITLHANDSAGGSTASLTSTTAVATPATPGSDLQHRTVYANPVQTHIDVPQYQPANQQLYRAVSGGYSLGGEIAPTGIQSASDVVFPMGYITTKRIYVTNQYGRYDNSTAFREVRIYTGVPVSMATSMADGTLDVGNGPSGRGIQTELYAPLNLFTPYMPSFQGQNFQPLTVHNDGNVNLLAVHLDQKQYGSGGPYILPLTADGLDSLSFIPAYDTTGFTGPINGATNGRKDPGGADVVLPGTSIPEFPYLVRSSLDTDLAQAYGRNPGILGGTDPVTGTALRNIYAGLTFHKARVGSAGPTTLTVPDVPYNNVQGSQFGLYAANTPAQKPTVASGQVVATDTNPASPTYNQVVSATAPPYVGVALPFGTPVGSYHGVVRLFEGMDVTGYTTYNGATYNPYYPPQYGGAVGGQGTPNLGAYHYPADVLLVGPQPVSDPGDTVRTSVLEDRLTDNFTASALPQIDAGPAGPVVAGNSTSAPDIAPAAYRDWTTRSLSVYWTSGRDASATTLPFDIYGMNVNYSSPAFLAAGGSTPGQSWWTPISTTYGKSQLFDDALANNPPTHSGLTVAPDQPVLSGGSFAGAGGVYAFDVAVTTAPYQDNLFCYPVTNGYGALGAGQLISSDPGQVKYGVNGLYLSTAKPFTNNLWAFWTTSTRGRTAIDYNSRVAGTGNWPQTTGLLPIPAGLTSVADPAPLLMTVPVIAPGGGLAGGTQPVIEITYSGTAPDGNVDLYESRYAPGTTAATASQLSLVSFPTVTEIMTPPAVSNGWYQTRDLAWSRTGALNLSIGGANILYDSSNKPLFSKAIFDKASGLLVLTGATLPGGTSGATTIYIDGVTGRVRFTSPPSGQVRATFNPMARRLTIDARADTQPITFLDPTFKTNDGDSAGGTSFSAVQADRRWYLWRKAAAAGDSHSATLYYKTQRLTLQLPTPIGLNGSNAPIISSVTLGGTDVTASVDIDWAGGRIFFPISLSAEGQQATVAYTDPAGQTHSITDAVQWQDEERSNSSATPPTDTASSLASVVDTVVPIASIVNESNVSAFLDTDAYLNTSASVQYSHKVWLFWNSTRNGTADLYYETIDPRFAAGP